MVASSITELLGTKNFGKSDGIIAYSSETFKNADLLERLGLSSYSDILQKSPTLDNVDDIYNILKDISEFSQTSKNSSTSTYIEFIFDNDKSNLISGEGFDTIIFLLKNSVLGFTVLESVQGSDIRTTSSSYDLNRNYRIKYIGIKVYSGDSNLRLGKDTIEIYSDIKSIAKVDSGNYIGVNNYNYSTKKDLEYNEGEKNYNIYLNSIIKSGKSSDIFTDTTFNRVKSDLSISSAKLYILKNMVLGSEYSDFNHIQLGYYSGDPSLFIWNDDNQYSIYSITRSIKSENNISRPYPYTVAKLGENNIPISRTNIFTLPLLYKGATQTINYFSGQFISVTIDSIKYLFDIERQSGEISASPLYSGNKGWIVESYTISETEYNYLILKTTGWVLTDESKDAVFYNSIEKAYVASLPLGSIIKIPKKIPTYLNYFIIDPVDLKNKIHVLNSDAWSSYSKAISIYPGFSEMYLNSKNAIATGAVLSKKIGDWYVFKKSSTIIYSNLTTVVKLSSSENEPIVVNNQVLITWSRINNTIKYTIYDNQGYFITDTCYNLLYDNNTKSYSDADSRGNKYKVISDESKMLSLRVGTELGNNISSPIEIQRSFLGPLRRNTLPQTLDGFSIVGSFLGLIFYRVGNTINYL